MTTNAPFGAVAQPVRQARALAAVAWAVTVVLARTMGNGLAVVIFTEKLWRHGKPFGQAVGGLPVAIAVLAIWLPWLLPGLHVSSMPTV